MLCGWTLVADPCRMRLLYGLIQAARCFLSLDVQRIVRTNLFPTSKPRRGYWIRLSIEWESRVVGSCGNRHAGSCAPFLSFSEEALIAKSIRNWRHWTAHEFGFHWQRDFFEHRLRDHESFVEKLDYVLQNPVRAGLVADWKDWPFTIVAQRASL